MATITNFRPSISSMSGSDLLIHIKTIRTLRRMIPEKVVRKTKTRKTTEKRNISVKDHLSNLTEKEKQNMLQTLLRLKGDT